MGLIKLNCSNCGAELEFDEKQKTGFCSHCGTKHVLEEVKNTTINNISNEYKIENATIVSENNGAPTKASLLKRAEKYVEEGDLINAFEYANKVLDIDPENETAKLILTQSFVLFGKPLTYEVVTQINRVLDTGKTGGELAREKARNMAYNIFVKHLLGKNSFLFLNTTITKFMMEWQSGGVNAAYNNIKTIAEINNKNVINKPKSFGGWFIVTSIFFLITIVLISWLVSTYIGEKNYVMGVQYEHEKNIIYNVYEAEICQEIPSSLSTIYESRVIRTTNYFVYLSIEIINNSDKEYNLNLSDFKLLTPNGNRYSATNYLYMYSRFQGVLKAGFSNKYHMCFEIPQNYQGEYVLVFEDEWKGDINVKLDKLKY